MIASTAPAIRTKALIDIERYIDSVLSRHVPLLGEQVVVDIPLTRDSWTTQDVDAVIAVYTAAGWLVSRPPELLARFVGDVDGVRGTWRRGPWVVEQSGQLVLIHRRGAHGRTVETITSPLASISDLRAALDSLADADIVGRAGRRDSK